MPYYGHRRAGPEPWTAKTLILLAALAAIVLFADTSSIGLAAIGGVSALLAVSELC